MGIATLDIDGPVNGDRESNTGEALALRRKDPQAYRKKYYTDKYNEMVEDWQAALDAAQSLPEISKTAVGYWGVSMRTRFGLPFTAAGKRVKTAVLGLFGYGKGATANQRVYDDAPKINVPVRFLQQIADEMIPNKAYWELFQMLGTKQTSGCTPVPVAISKYRKKKSSHPGCIWPIDWLKTNAAKNMRKTD